MFPLHWSKKLCFVLLISLVVVECKHAALDEPPPPQPLLEIKSGLEQTLVDEGDSFQADYNAAGDKILYVSRRAASHQQAQVYEKDLTTGLERRITFQNGNTMNPHYHPKEGWIVYASSTDELKENPPLLHPTSATSKLPAPYQEPMEVYAHNLRGLEIVRVTEHLGFDGEARFSKDGETLFYTHIEGAKSEIKAMNRATRDTHVVKGLGVNPTQYVGSPDAKSRAWIEWDESFGVAKLRYQKNGGKIVEIGSDMIVPKTDLSFSPDGNFLLWAQKNIKTSTYDLWLADLQSTCARRIDPPASGKDELRDPRISPDMKWLTFSLLHKDRSRIVRVAFAPPTGPCPTAQ